MVMKRRSFLQAVGGAIAAVFMPVVAAEQVKRLIAFPPPRLAMSFLNTEYGQSIPITPPETLAELRAAIEANYDKVSSLSGWHHDGILVSGFYLTKTVPDEAYETAGPVYSHIIIFGRGATEKEAVANAFETLNYGPARKEMLWRRDLSLDRHGFSETEFVVRGRMLVLR